MTTTSTSGMLRPWWHIVRESFGLLAICIALPFSAVAADRPNILVFLADDVGYGDVGAYNPGSMIPTPNIDALAAQGMRFTDAHSSAAMCAPTRYSIMSGNYHWRGRHAWGQWNYFGKSQILPGQLTLAGMLRDAGYHTGMIGKLHMGGQFYQIGSNSFVPWNGTEDQIDFGRRFRDGPLDFGFDYSFLVLNGIQKSPYAFFENDQLVGDPNDLIVWQAGLYGRSRIREDGIGMPDWDSSNVGPTLLAKAIEFIDAHHQANLAQGSDQPFFLYYSAQAAHAPFTPPPDLSGEPIEGVTGLSAHADMIYEADVALGRLVEALEQRGLLHDTLIVFTSDNGGNILAADAEMGHDSSGGLRGQKGAIWEGGHRVPFIVRWGDGTPGGSVVAPATTSDELFGLHDLMATLASAVDVRLPADQARDSFDFWPELTGAQPPGTPARDSLLVEAPLSLQSGTVRQFAVRDGDWKLVFDENGLPVALHDLAADLQEAANLIGDSQYATLVQRMQSVFLWRKANARTAPIATQPPPRLLGRPGYQAAVDAGVYVWKDTFNGPYRLRVNGGGAAYAYDVIVVGDRVFSAVSPDSLEANDSLVFTSAEIRLAGVVGAGEDGVDFELSADGAFMLRMNRAGAPFLGGIRTGQESEPQISTAWIIALEDLPPAPALQGGQSVGVFLGRDVAPDSVSVRWNGDGLRHDFDSGFLFSRPLVAANPRSIEACCDVLTVTTHSLDAVGTVSTWWDGVDLQLAPATQVGFAHFFDGRNQPFLVNPSTGDFGVPNAYVVESPDGRGQPDFDPAFDKALFVWRGADNSWHIRGTAGGDFAKYAGSLAASAPFDSVVGISLEPNYGDLVETVNQGEGQQINFELRMAQAWFDGIDLRVPAGASLTLTIDEARTTGPVLIGRETWPVDLPVIVLPTE